jgi:4-hydroxybenzoate polyprenyltransferase
MAICIPFDIRDIKIDIAENITTIPQLLGELKTRRLALFFVFMTILTIVFEHHLNFIHTPQFIALLISTTISGAIIFMSSVKRGEFFYIVLLDGTMILQGVLMWTSIA